MVHRRRGTPRPPGPTEAASTGPSRAPTAMSRRNPRPRGPPSATPIPTREGRGSRRAASRPGRPATPAGSERLGLHAPNRVLQEARVVVTTDDDTDQWLLHRTAPRSVLTGPSGSGQSEPSAAAG